MIIGHGKLWQSFKRFAEEGDLAHGYLFFGEPQVGKFTFARRLASFLENEEAVLVDVKIISPDENGVIEIDSIRDAKVFLSTKPLRSPKKTVIIDGAENLAGAAQNALLKIAEEPPSAALIVMIAVSPDSLLPTLVSRFQKVYFSRVGRKEIAAGFPNLPKTALESAFGRPGRALEIAAGDPVVLKARKMAVEFLKEGRRRGVVEAIIDDERLLDKTFEFLIADLRKDPVKNVNLLKTVINRFKLMKQFNTNRRLQLEAV